MSENSEIVLSVEMGDSTSARTAEAYAVGKRNGVDVTEGDPAYQNNAKYYAEQTGADISEAVEARDAAIEAQEAAEDARDRAETAQDKAEDAAEEAETKVQQIKGMTVAAETSAAPTATISEVGDHLHILFGLVKGDKGDTGAKGDKGDRGDPGEESTLTPELISGTDYRLVMERS